MSAQMTPVMQAASDFALVGGIAFTAFGVYLSVRQRRVHPLLLLCISTAIASIPTGLPTFVQAML